MDFDLAKLTLEFLDIFSQGAFQRFGVHWCHDDPGEDPRFGGAGHDPGKIDDDFGRGVGDHGHVGIDPLGFLFSEFYVNLLARLRFHKSSTSRGSISALVRCQPV